MRRQSQFLNQQDRGLRTISKSAHSCFSEVNGASILKYEAPTSWVPPGAIGPGKHACVYVSDADAIPDLKVSHMSAKSAFRTDGRCSSFVFESPANRS
jgi:hypothetical protein